MLAFAEVPGPCHPGRPRSTMPSLITFYLSTLALLAPLITCAGVGLYWGKRQLPFSANFLALLVTSVSTPSLVFSTLYSTSLDNRTLLDIAIAVTLALLLAMLLCALALKLLGLPLRALLQTATFPNAGNLGLPLSLLAFGEAGFSAAVAFFAISSFMQNTLGVRTLPDGRQAASWRSPIVVASFTAVACRLLDLSLPEWLLESTRLLGTLTVPLMLVSLGYALSSIPASGLRGGSVVAALRLVIGLASGWAVTWLLGLSPLLSGVVILQMTMPCAVLSYMYASRYTNKAEISAGAVLVSTVAFLLLSPFLLRWLAPGAF